MEIHYPSIQGMKDNLMREYECAREAGLTNDQLPSIVNAIQKLTGHSIDQIFPQYNPVEQMELDLNDDRVIDFNI
jgi:hypothetical protein